MVLARFVHIEFTPGSWLDVTADYDNGQGLQIRYGRSTPYSPPQQASLTLQLNNKTGKYTPRSQLLADGVTTNPNWPNIQPRKRIRTGYVISATNYFDFWGYIQEWQPLLEGGVRPFMQITAVDRTAILAGFVVKNGAAVQSMLTDSPLVLYPFNDPSGATAWGDLIAGRSAYPYGNASAAWITTGSEAPTPFADGQTGLLITGYPSTVTQQIGWQSPPIPTPSSANTTWTIEGWITVTPDATTAAYPNGIITVSSASGNTTCRVETEIFGVPVTPQIAVFYTDAGGSTNLTLYLLPNPTASHHYVVTGVDNGTNLTITLYVDGVAVESSTGATGHGDFGASTVRVVGTSAEEFILTATPVVFGPCAFYATALNSPTVALHTAGGTGGLGYTTGQRQIEYLRWAGVAIGDQNVSVGQQTVSDHEVAGKDINTLCQDMALTEGGGAVFYATADGKLQGIDRHYRSTQTPLITLDGAKDLGDGNQWQPSLDSLTLVTLSTLSRPGGSDQTYAGVTAEAADGIATDTAQTTVYPDTDQGLLNLAQDRVASQEFPAYRLSQVTLAVQTALTTGLYQLLASGGSMNIGSRMRVQNLVPSISAPWTQVDVYIEGWTITSKFDTYNVVFDTSPADNPARAKFDTARWAPVPGNMTLNANINASVTTEAIANSDGFFLTTTSGSYPLSIMIGEEQQTLTAVPGGSSSPQTFTTAVTRGANNTRAAAQSASAAVSLAPAYTWQL